MSRSGVAARLARLERERTANANNVAVVRQYTDSDPEELKRQVAEAEATGALVVVIRRFRPRPVRG
jgi:LmbE family N-acetylglucosaminyl deacetylase